ncbi:MAG: HD domain-containing protein [Phycisphaerales bacterium]
MSDPVDANASGHPAPGDRGPARWDADLVLAAAEFAAAAHAGQTMKRHNFPYLLHVTSVAFETAGAIAADPSLDGTLAMACAMLHDVVEDTDRSADDIATTFSPAIAAGVQALTKRSDVPKPEAMRDSLDRLLQQPASVQAVKLADRIVNLQSPPPTWSTERCMAYAAEGELIGRTLGAACPFLADRLHATRVAYLERFAGAG